MPTPPLDWLVPATGPLPAEGTTTAHRGPSPVRRTGRWFAASLLALAALAVGIGAVQAHHHPTTTVYRVCVTGTAGCP